jgi:ribosomal protein S18 acetylase RimI-like enzyme
MTLRPATPADATDTAALVDIAGHGLPAFLWGRAKVAGGVHSALEIGRERAMRDAPDTFSFRCTVIAEVDGRIAGLWLGYCQPQTFDYGDPAGWDPILAPLLELEMTEPDIWYLNVLAVYAEFRGQGIGAALIADAERAARASGADKAGLIVEDDNSALRLYEAAGYEKAASRPFVPFPGSTKSDGEWQMMVKRLEAARDGE